MRIALIADTHWGVRNDSPYHLDNLKKTLDDTFFPYLKEHSIEHVIHLGDLVDRRKSITFGTAQRLRTDFLDRFDPDDLNIDLRIIAGNHDVSFKNSLNTNIYYALFGESSLRRVTPITEVVEYDDGMIFVPWICEENEEEVYNKIKATKARVCIGHFDFEGFDYFKGVKATHGRGKEAFSKFDLVVSGHYHHRSHGGNVRYIGAFNDHTWNDCGDYRGFAVLDTDDLTLEYIETPNRMFHRVSNPTAVDTKWKDCYLKLFLDKPNDALIDAIVDLGVIDLQVVTPEISYEIDEEVLQTETTFDMVKSYVGQIDYARKEELSTLMHQLYLDAVADIQNPSL